ncbi:MAG: hypothetical protein AB1473_22580 [Thermodesulfobacteriota bacterium]
MFALRAVAHAIALVLLFTGAAGATSIQRVEGIVSEVEEGYLLVKPDGQEKTIRLILRWKARFVPPKLPLKGDRVLVLYKDKPEGAVIYEVRYQKNGAGQMPLAPDSASKGSK